MLLRVTDMALVNFITINLNLEINMFQYIITFTYTMLHVTNRTWWKLQPMARTNLSGHFVPKIIFLSTFDKYILHMNKDWS